MLPRIPRLAARSTQPLISTLRQTRLQARTVAAATTTTTPFRRLASSHSAAHELKGSDGGHHEADHDSHGGGHEDHYDPPGGWLWGVRPGEKAEKEGWEPYAWAFVGLWVVAVAAYTMKEDTS